MNNTKLNGTFLEKSSEKQEGILNVAQNTQKKQIQELLEVVRTNENCKSNLVKRITEVILNGKKEEFDKTIDKKVAEKLNTYTFSNYEQNLLESADYGIEIKNEINLVDITEMQVEKVLIKLLVDYANNIGKSYDEISNSKELLNQFYKIAEKQIILEKMDNFKSDIIISLTDYRVFYTLECLQNELIEEKEGLLSEITDLKEEISEEIEELKCEQYEIETELISLKSEEKPDYEKILKTEKEFTDIKEEITAGYWSVEVEKLKNELGPQISKLTERIFKIEDWMSELEL